MQGSSVFTVIQTQQKGLFYHLRKKIFAPGEDVSGPLDQAEERLLFLCSEPEVLYVPGKALPYSFTETTQAYELTLTERSIQLGANNYQDQNPVSPFYLTGDACFYNFLARKIRIGGPVSFYNKKKVDFIWILKGDLRLVSEDEVIIPEPYTMILVEKNEISYQISGNGEIFLLKL